MNEKRERDGSEDAIMQQYPSPSAEGHDNAAQFYNATSASNEAQQPQPSQDPPTPTQQDQQQSQHQQRNSIPNADELRLAAQLTENLSAIMPDADLNQDPNLRNVMNQSSVDQSMHDDQPLPASEPQMVAQHDGMPQHDGLSQHEPIPSHDQMQQLQQHQTSLPHHEAPQPPSQPQPSQYVQEHHQPVLAPQLPLDHMQQQFGTVHDNTPPRKRSKVSRACDECRRKKVKCDAPSETGEDPCSNCRRSSIPCLFSRVPQKRGPSKGYIKELADRINSIEGKLGSGGAEDLNRKRTYSTSISGGDLSTPTGVGVSQLANWGSEQRPLQPFETPTRYPAPTPYNPSSLAPAPPMRIESAAPSKPTTALASVPDAQVHEIDDSSFLHYLSHIHLVTPFLPSSKTRLQVELARCPEALRTAFIAAFHLAMGLVSNSPDIAIVNGLIMEWENTPGEIARHMTLVHIQTLLLAALAADTAGPEPQYRILTHGHFLRRATDLAVSSKISSVFISNSLDIDTDPDAEILVLARVWWSLVILDRFNAVGSGIPVHIPSEEVIIVPVLKKVLGEGVYYIAELADSIAHLVTLIRAPIEESLKSYASLTALRSLGTQLVDKIRLALPDHISPATHPMVHLSYWHARLISYIVACPLPSTAAEKASELVWCLMSIAELIPTTALISTPLSHHFTCLAVRTLHELTKLPQHRDDATVSLTRILESNPALHVWTEATARKHVTEQNRPSTSTGLGTTAQSTASQSLQHLADLATTGLASAAVEKSDAAEEPVPAVPNATSASVPAPGEETPAATPFNVFTMLKEGYLNNLTAPLKETVFGQ